MDTSIFESDVLPLGEDSADLFLGSRLQITHKKLGSGAYGVIWAALLDSNPVAAKVTTLLVKVKKGARDVQCIMKEFIDDICVLASFQHPNIVKVYGLDVIPSEKALLEMEGRVKVKFILVMEQADTNLREYIQTGIESELMFSKKLKLAHDIAEGMKYLHHHSITHLDLKTDNVLVNISEDRAFLTDFNVQPDFWMQMKHRFQKGGNFKFKKQKDKYRKKVMEYANTGYRTRNISPVELQEFLSESDEEPGYAGLLTSSASVSDPTRLTSTEELQEEEESEGSGVDHAGYSFYSSVDFNLPVQQMDLMPEQQDSEELSEMSDEACGYDFMEDIAQMDHIKTENVSVAPKEENAIRKYYDSGYVAAERTPETKILDRGFLAALFRPLEFFRGGYAEIDQSVDVYSFSMVIYELFFGKIPFFDQCDTVSELRRLLEKHERPPIPLYCPPQLSVLLKKCWDSDPKVRPDFNMICDSLPALQGMNSMAYPPEKFWKKFSTKGTLDAQTLLVPWKQFIKALMEFCFLKKKIIFFTYNQKVKSRAIKIVTVDREHKDKEVVSWASFQQAVARYGPLTRGITFIDNIYNTMKTPGYFASSLSKDEAKHFVGNGKIGSFIFLDGPSPNFIALYKTSDPKGVVESPIINYGYCVVFEGNEYQNLQQLFDMHSAVLKYPIGGTPFKKMQVGYKEKEEKERMAFLEDIIKLPPEETYLRIGEKILIFGESLSTGTETFQGYLTSTGGQSASCKLRKCRLGREPASLSECFFIIHPSYQYGKNKQQLQGESEEAVRKYEFDKMKGSVVSYGQTIQLLHERSNKFVTVNTEEPSNIVLDYSDTALPVTLDSEGNAGSWFSINPRFKYKSNGQRIQIGEAVSFISYKYNSYLRGFVSDKLDGEVDVHTSYELFQTFGWRIIPIIPKCADDPSILCPGDVVGLFHKEDQGFITHEHEEVFLHKKHSNVRPVYSNVKAISVDPKEEYEHVHSNAMWLVEPERAFDFNRKNIVKFRFQHLATKRYLSVQYRKKTKMIARETKLQEDMNNSGDKRHFLFSTRDMTTSMMLSTDSNQSDQLSNQIDPENSDAFIEEEDSILQCTVTEDSTDPATLFSFVHSNGNIFTKEVPLTARVRLKHCKTNTYLHTGYSQKTKKTVIFSEAVRHDQDVFGLTLIQRSHVTCFLEAADLYLQVQNYLFTVNRRNLVLVPQDLNLPYEYIEPFYPQGTSPCEIKNDKKLSYILGCRTTDSSNIIMKKHKNCIFFYSKESTLVNQRATEWIQCSDNNQLLYGNVVCLLLYQSIEHLLNCELRSIHQSNVNDILWKIIGVCQEGVSFFTRSLGEQKIARQILDQVSSHIVKKEKMTTRKKIDMELLPLTEELQLSLYKLLTLIIQLNANIRISEITPIVNYILIHLKYLDKVPPISMHTCTQLIKHNPSIQRIKIFTAPVTTWFSDNCQNWQLPKFLMVFCKNYQEKTTQVVKLEQRLAANQNWIYALVFIHFSHLLILPVLENKVLKIRDYGTNTTCDIDTFWNSSDADQKLWITYLLKLYAYMTHVDVDTEKLPLDLVIKCTKSEELDVKLRTCCCNILRSIYCKKIGPDYERTPVLSYVRKWSNLQGENTETENLPEKELGNRFEKILKFILNYLKACFNEESLLAMNYKELKFPLSVIKLLKRLFMLKYMYISKTREDRIKDEIIPILCDLLIQLSSKQMIGMMESSTRNETKKSTLIVKIQRDTCKIFDLCSEWKQDKRLTMLLLFMREDIIREKEMFASTDTPDSDKGKEIITDETSPLTTELDKSGIMHIKAQVEQISVWGTIPEEAKIMDSFIELVQCNNHTLSFFAASILLNILRSTSVKRLYDNLMKVEAIAEVDVLHYRTLGKLTKMVGSIISKLDNTRMSVQRIEMHTKTLGRIFLSVTLIYFDSPLCWKTLEQLLYELEEHQPASDLKRTEILTSKKSNVASYEDILKYFQKQIKYECSKGARGSVQNLVKIADFHSYVFEILSKMFDSRFSGNIALLPNQSKRFLFECCYCFLCYFFTTNNGINMITAQLVFNKLPLFLHFLEKVPWMKKSILHLLENLFHENPVLWHMLTEVQAQKIKKFSKTTYQKLKASNVSALEVVTGSRLALQKAQSTASNFYRQIHKTLKAFGDEIQKIISDKETTNRLHTQTSYTAHSGVQLQGEIELSIIAGNTEVRSLASSFDSNENFMRKFVSLLLDYQIDSTNQNFFNVPLKAISLLLKSANTNVESTLQGSKGETIKQKFNHLGVPKLVLKLLSVPHLDNEVQNNTLDLGITLLEGTEADLKTIQKTFISLLENNEVKGFAKNISHILRQEASRMRQRARFYKSVRKNSTITDSGLRKWARKQKFEDSGMKKLLRFLQLLCEGHNSELQNYLRSQRTATDFSFNIVNDTAELLNPLHELLNIFYEDSRLTDITQQLFATLSEYCEGPCKENQQALALSTDLPRMMSSILQLEDKKQSQVNLKIESSCLGTIISILEGVSKNNNEVPDRFLYIFNPIVHILKQKVSKSITNAASLFAQSKSEKEGNRLKKTASQYMKLSTLYLCVMKTLIFFDKGSDNKLELAVKELEETHPILTKSVRSIEIVHADGNYGVIYFDVPTMCHHLTEKSKLEVMETVDRDSQTTMNEDFFLKKRITLVHEMKHRAEIFPEVTYQYLDCDPSFWSRIQNFQLSDPKHEDHIGNTSFFIALLINLLMVSGYYYDTTGESMEDSNYFNYAYPHINPILLLAIYLLTILHFAISICNFILLYWLYGVLRRSIKIEKKQRKLQKKKEREFQKKKVEQEVIKFLLTIIFPSLLFVTKFIIQTIDSKILIKYNTTRKMSESIKKISKMTVDLWEKHDVTQKILNVDRTTIYCLAEPRVFWSLISVFISFLALVSSPFWMCLFLLHVTGKIRLLRKVLQSVTVHWRSIAATGVLATVVIYIYSVLAFLYFRNAFDVEHDDKVCDTLLSCFSHLGNFGVRSGGGIGDVMAMPSWQTAGIFYYIIYQTSFFFIVILLFLNIIFGIIIDTFGELRSSQRIIDQQVKNQCFICGIDHQTFNLHFNEGCSEFNSQNSTWKQHLQTYHNLWDYLAFVVYITETQEYHNLSGPEQYVRDKLDMADLSFLPFYSDERK